MIVVSPKKHGGAERVADISRRLMENPETGACQVVCVWGWGL